MEKVRLECPVCHRGFEVDSMFAGANCRCPVCQCELTSPMCCNDPKNRKKLTLAYKLYLWFSIISLTVFAIGIPAMGVLMARQYTGQSDKPSADMLKIGVMLLLIFLVMAATAITALVFKCILLYRLWKLVPPERAATTPGQAVGFLFIPIFNLYWNFVAFLKLGIFLENESGSPSPRRLALISALLPLVGIVMNIVADDTGFLFQLAVAASTVEILMMASFMNAVRRWRNWE